MNWIKEQQAKLAGLAPEDIEWATKVGNKYPANSQWLGHGDAARHMALGYLSAKAYLDNPGNRGLFNPVFLSDMREFGLHDMIPGYKNLDNEMDRKNNNIGHTLVTLASTKEEAEQLIDKMITSSVLKAETQEQVQSSQIPVVIKSGYKAYTGAPYATTNKDRK